VSEKKSFGGTFYFSNCHIIRLDNGSLVLIVFGSIAKIKDTHLLQACQNEPFKEHFGEEKYSLAMCFDICVGRNQVQS
jgi:hypothetical protein